MIMAMDFTQCALRKAVSLSNFQDEPQSPSRSSIQQNGFQQAKAEMQYTHSGFRRYKKSLESALKGGDEFTLPLGESSQFSQGRDGAGRRVCTLHSVPVASARADR
jgi:hypothetical protein